MGQGFSKRPPSDFPPNLMQAAQDLQPLHIAGFAWRYPAILDVIAWLAECGYAILGGDVFQEGGGQGRVLTYDNWHHDWAQGQPWHNYVQDSARKAQQYIEAYHQRNGDSYSYSLVFATEGQYRALTNRA